MITWRGNWLFNNHFVLSEESFECKSVTRKELPGDSIKEVLYILALFSRLSSFIVWNGSIVVLYLTCFFRNSCLVQECSSGRYYCSSIPQTNPVLLFYIVICRLQMKIGSCCRSFFLENQLYSENENSQYNFHCFINKNIA